MTDPIPMDDDGGALWHQLQLEREQWEQELARDEAARREFDDWIASQREIPIYEPTKDETSWDDTHPKLAAVTSRKCLPAHT